MEEFLDRAVPWAITLVLHNWPVMLYTLIAAVTAVRAYIDPSRPILLFLYGTILLIIAYEYEKHGRGAIIGTTDYLFSLEVNHHLRAGSQWLLLDVLPVGMRILGFGQIIGSIVLREIQMRQRSRPRRAIFVDL